MKFFIGLIAFAGLCFVKSSAQEFGYNYNFVGAPAYGSAPAASYGAAPASYGAAPAAYSAPSSSYSAPAAPSYSAPAPVYSAKPSYGPAPRPGPAQSYTYPSAAPSVPCATNLLLSCAPQVSPVGCSSVQYAQAKPSYGSAPAYAPAAPAYHAPAAPAYHAPAQSYSAPSRPSY